MQNSKQIYQSQNWKQNFQQSSSTKSYGPVYNKIQQPKEPKTVCQICPLGPDVCNETGPSNVLHGRKPRQYITEPFIRRLLKEKENGKLNNKRTVVEHPFPDNFSEIKKFAEGKLPCVYCFVNLCDRWDKGEREQHIYGKYYAWSVQDVDNFVEIWMSTFQKKKPNINSKSNATNDKTNDIKSQPKNISVATTSTSTSDTKSTERHLLHEITKIRNELQASIRNQTQSDKKAKYDEVSDETREQIRQEILLEMKQEQKYKKRNNNNKQKEVTDSINTNAKFQIGMASQDVRQKLKQTNNNRPKYNQYDTVSYQTKMKLQGLDLTDQTKEIMADKKPIGTLFSNTAS